MGVSFARPRAAVGEWQGQLRASTDEKATAPAVFRFSASVSPTVLTDSTLSLQQCLAGDRLAAQRGGDAEAQAGVVGDVAQGLGEVVLARSAGQGDGVQHRAAG
jgi:hypothetical protein